MDQLPPFVVDHNWVPDSLSLSKAAACLSSHLRM
jgi:hypothetical protein